MNAQVQERLPELLELAHDRSESGRLALASKLADLFLMDDVSLTAREEDLINELIDLLLKAGSSTVRQALAQCFADTARMPRKMAMGFACDSLDVAHDVLLNNPALTDDDLITVVETKGRDHACVVAARQSLNEAVADALVTTNDLQVMQIVAENLGAKLSPRAIDALAEASRLAQTLQRPVLERPELTQELATRLYWWIAQDLRRIALQRFNISAGQIDAALAKAINEKLNEHILERNEDAAMGRVLNWLEERQAIAPRLLPQLLRLGHFRLFNLALGRMCHLDPPLIGVVVSETGGRMLAALCRALDIDKATFVSIFLLSRGSRPDEQIVHPRELSHALAAFDRLTPALAQDLVYSWRKNPSYILQHQDELTALEA